MTEPTAGAAELQERFLVVAPTGRDGPLTCALLARAGLRCEPCRTIDELCARVTEEGAAGVLIAEEVLVPSAVQRLVALLARQEPWSDLPVLLFTSQNHTIQARPPTAQLLAPLGNVTLLDRPLRPITMISAASAALRGRRRQYTVRDAIADQQRAVRLRDQFLAMLGHELRNPLGTILMAIDLLDEDDDDAGKYRAIVRRQSRHLARLVDDLLDVSRVTSGKIVLQRVPVDLGELLGRCLQAMDPAIKARDLHVTPHLPRAPVAVHGDPVRLEQVVVNLVTNAVKYTAPGGHLDVAVDRDDRDAVLRIADDGAGIAADMLPRVFDLFAQADGTLDRSQGGMGIGLTLVRSLVELHGGRVEAASPGPGAGSVFTVRLPMPDAGVQGDGGTPAAAVADGPTTYDVLLVEDNADSRELLGHILRTAGHRVDAVGDGLTAVAHALERRPQVMVVDIGLPGLDGLGVARQVRAALGAGVYLVAMTGYGQPDDRRRALEAGFDVHFTKPVDLGALRQLLGRPDLLLEAGADQVGAGAAHAQERWRRRRGASR